MTLILAAASYIAGYQVMAAILGWRAWEHGYFENEFLPGLILTCLAWPLVLPLLLPWEAGRWLRSKKGY